MGISFPRSHQTERNTYPPSNIKMNPPIPPSALALTLLMAASSTAQYFQNPCHLNEELYFVPHPSECNKYYMCHFQQGGLFTCPGNLQFNPDLDVCDYPDVVR